VSESDAAADAATAADVARAADVATAAEAAAAEAALAAEVPARDDSVGEQSVEEPATEPAEVVEDDFDAEVGAAQMVLTDPAELDAAVEAILFVVDAPIDASTLAATLQVPVPDVTAALDRLHAGYDERGAGIELREAAGGVRLYTRASVAPHVERFLQDGQRSRLSQAALETLAVIAYRQPVTRARVSAIRGVNVDGVVRTLLSRGLIVEVGSDPESGAGLFRTSELFLERMGMQSLDELPSLAPMLPDITGLESGEI
jgi:segregation and condensation protein B